MALSLVLIIQSLLDKNDICLADFFPRGKHLTEVLTVFVSIVVFIFGSKLLGYLAANTLMILILTLNKLKWYRSVIVSFGVSVILYVLFHEILLLRLPVGILGF
jgi:hypothetical protein